VDLAEIEHRYWVAWRREQMERLRAYIQRAEERLAASIAAAFIRARREERREPPG
jgi:hypothetical protein